MKDLRIKKHPILGEAKFGKKITIFVDGKKFSAYEGEMIASALYAKGIRKLRATSKFKEPRGIFCAIGRCTDCVMTVNGVPNIRTCITPVQSGMRVKTQKGLGKWKK
ncbi:dehydrogenase [Candidatus Desantisbacteria bacterium CG1_02_38_46]|uniref:Dehydrogenase n=3 Tax=unclassified Candidatus Desantisiibacteriota TaxID=3106372 RepID=A0A2H9PCZ8_9BACT|nr:MAG: dehydrogenase [Candidatus Desantisbacteria bacterium CG1_02_38_46]PIU50725.1 MAG: dehydrogenase [Candidatus Desantisbacteria bacterium CG07_land_8_20_14_0_80_39_15]PIZ16421.1 MAG: dehydrogenase [Candidatus Desantisbacteria bacterium CG_4_10_14_0_8_um_filter_39_17]